MDGMLDWMDWVGWGGWMINCTGWINFVLSTLFSNKCLTIEYHRKIKSSLFLFCLVYSKQQSKTKQKLNQYVPSWNLPFFYRPKLLNSSPEHVDNIEFSLSFAVHYLDRIKSGKVILTSQCSHLTSIFFNHSREEKIHSEQLVFW